MADANIVSLVAESPGDPAQVAAALKQQLDKLRAGVEREPYPTTAVRKDRLQRGIDTLLKYEPRIVEAAHADFGARSEVTTLLADVMSTVMALRHAQKHLDQWIKPERHRPDFPMGLLGVRAYVFYQPVGVVGIIGPWNVPFGLTWGPLSTALAAGNRAMLKPSELTPNMAALIAEMTANAFAEDEVSVVQGGVEISRQFAMLPFDHIVFTGGTQTGRHILRAAAENLTPVTLELGGKSPTIVAKGADLDYVAAKIASAKGTNAGQVCVSPDFVMVHKDDRDALVDKIAAAFNRYYPDFERNPDVTNVHMERNRSRIAGIVSDAIQRGATVKLATGAKPETLGSSARFPLALVVDPPLDAASMQEEMFGPVLSIISYNDLAEVVKLLRSRERPLALYFLGGSAEEKDYILKNTYAGGVSLDEVMFHPFHQDLPFGGVGHSGMGRLFGFAGFKTLSNQKAVAQKGWLDITKYLAPPYNPKMAGWLRRALRF